MRAIISLHHSTLLCLFKGCPSFLSQFQNSLTFDVDILFFLMGGSKLDGKQPEFKTRSATFRPLAFPGPQVHRASQHRVTLAWVFSGCYEEKIICVNGKELCLLSCPHTRGCNQALTKPVRWIFFPRNCCSIFPEGHLPPQTTFSLLLSTVKLTCLEHKGAPSVCESCLQCLY